MNVQLDSLTVLQSRVIQSGDTLSYEKLKTEAIDNSINNLLLYSLIMANKYDYQPAKYDFYYITLTANGYNIFSVDSLDHRTKAIALDFLESAASNGVGSAIMVLDSIKPRWRTQRIDSTQIPYEHF